MRGNKCWVVIMEMDYGMDGGMGIIILGCFTDEAKMIKFRDAAYNKYNRPRKMDRTVYSEEFSINIETDVPIGRL